MFIDLFSLSNILSALAVIFSFYSIIYAKQQSDYAKKQYEADFFPHISLKVSQRSCGKSGLKTCLSFSFKNHSIDRTVANLKMQAFLSHPKLKWRLWTIKWFKFFEQDNIEISPEEKKVTQPLSIGPYAEGLENFLLESFPKLVYRENDPNTPEEVAFREKADFLLLVQVAYKANIWHAREIPRKYYYKLTPKFHRNNGDQYCLYYWDIQFLKDV